MKKILVANRGEIAVRIMKTCREMGIATVAVASEIDMDAYHAEFADECVFLGPNPAGESYLAIDKVIEAAKQTGADGIHPGFGFLSENAAFAEAVGEAGVKFIGPSAEVIAAMGSKQASKRIMSKAGVPLVPGYHGDDQSPALLAEQAEAIGFPVLIKASAGGGGKGMRVVPNPEAFTQALATAKREALNAFGDDTVLLEKYLEEPHHIEFQIFGDEQGHIVHLFERECSIQRRHQKIVEETPSPALNEALRAKMAKAALDAAKAVNYTSAGTVEFMLDRHGNFYFLEMNTRLQVEHPITEMVTGLDLVRWQILVAAGESLPLSQSQIQATGHSLEVRIYAEDPDHEFLPQTGQVIGLWEPEGLGIRLDSGIRRGDHVSIHYDPMLAKLITWAPTREIAIEKMRAALNHFSIHGVRTNLGFLGRVLGHQAFQDGNTPTSFIESHRDSLGLRSDHLEKAMGLVFLTAGSARRPGAKSEVQAEPWDTLTGWRAMA